MGSNSCAHRAEQLDYITLRDIKWRDIIVRLVRFNIERIQWPAIGLALKRNKGIRAVPQTAAIWAEVGRRLNRHKDLFRKYNERSMEPRLVDQ